MTSSWDESSVMSTSPSHAISVLRQNPTWNDQCALPSLSISCYVLCYWHNTIWRGQFWGNWPFIIHANDWLSKTQRLCNAGSLLRLLRMAYGSEIWTVLCAHDSDIFVFNCRFGIKVGKWTSTKHSRECIYSSRGQFTHYFISYTI